jgi:hypothetical protein
MVHIIAAALVVLISAAPAAAAGFNLEASTDLRRHGLGWSDGRPAVEVWGTLTVADGLSVEAGAATLRGSKRHGGADLLGEAALRYTRQAGPWTLWADAQGLGFAGASGQSYGQLRAGTALGIGPAQLSFQASWAPPQAAIGGSTIYMRGNASVGVPATPWTLRAGIGRSFGTDDGSGRSNRLRPGGAYTDVRVDADYVLGPLTLGASLTATTVNTGRIVAPDSSTRLLFRAAIGF